MADADLVQAAVAALQVPDLRPRKPALERDAEDTRQETRGHRSILAKEDSPVDRPGVRSSLEVFHQPGGAPGGAGGRTPHHPEAGCGPEFGQGPDGASLRAVVELLEKLEAVGRLTSIPSLVASCRGHDRTRN